MLSQLRLGKRSVPLVGRPSPEDLNQVLKKLHKNLGHHPPNQDLVRILKHGQASPEAIDAARSFQCDFCKSQSKPIVPLPAQPNRVHEFNHHIGLDVKQLNGWLPNQKIKAMNIVDTASSFQRVIPFFETETATLLRKLKEIILDPARTNLGDMMVTPCEWEGALIRPIAAVAHWQLGKTESHGGWFGHVLDRVIADNQPATKA